MVVTDEMVDKLAYLSRLSFNELEKKEIRTDLEQLIAFVDKLKEINVDGVEPLIHMSAEVNVLRPDNVEGSTTREEALKNAPAATKEFFTVPRVIKK